MKTLINLVIILLSATFINAHVVQKAYLVPNEITIIGLKIITNNNRLKTLPSDQPTKDTKGVQDTESTNVAVDIQKLLNKLFSEQFINKLSSQKVDYIYIVYSNYKNQTEGNFVVTVGVKVEGKIDSLPNGATIITIPAGPYSQFHVTGESFDVVTATWGKIWQIWGDNNTKNSMVRSEQIDYKPLDIWSNRHMKNTTDDTKNNSTTKLPSGVNYEAWRILTDDTLKSNNTTRAYKVDYEVYPIELLANPKVAPVAMDIFIGIK